MVVVILWCWHYLVISLPVLCISPIPGVIHYHPLADTLNTYAGVVPDVAFQIVVISQASPLITVPEKWVAQIGCDALEWIASQYASQIPWRASKSTLDAVRNGPAVGNAWLFQASKPYGVDTAER